MKYLIAFLIALQIFCNASFAQCPIPCCDESFPYGFCKNGKIVIACSTNPSTEHPAGATPALSFIPGCITVFTMPTLGQYQPIGDSVGLPTDPDDITQFDNNGEELVAAVQQADHDILLMNSGLRPTFDSSMFFDSIEIVGGLKQYGIDTTIYNREKNNYVKVWDQAQADSDANFALQQWLKICPDVKSLSLKNAAQAPDHKDHKNCCINIIGDDNTDHWRQFGNPLGSAHTDALGCGETDCPTRNIRFNRTPAFLFFGNDPQNKADPKYWLHQVQRGAIYTGTTPPSPIPFVGSDTTNPQYFAVSFRELIEHELGHIFGLFHPDQRTSNDSTCRNNATSCDSFMVMTAGLTPNAASHNLSKDDSCMFKKLYCSDCPTTGVYDRGKKFEFSPEVYPNPTNGSTLLEYSIDKEEIVEVSLYNLLGREIINVVSERQGEGDHVIPLPTEYLASGQYICRIKAGEINKSIKVVITK